jgi:hypothetical protein
VIEPFSIGAMSTWNLNGSSWSNFITQLDFLIFKCLNLKSLRLSWYWALSSKYGNVSKKAFFKLSEISWPKIISDWAVLNRSHEYLEFAWVFLIKLHYPIRLSHIQLFKFKIIEIIVILGFIKQVWERVKKSIL